MTEFWLTSGSEPHGSGMEKLATRDHDSESIDVFV